MAAQAYLRDDDVNRGGDGGGDVNHGSRNHHPYIFHHDEARLRNVTNIRRNTAFDRKEHRRNQMQNHHNALHFHGPGFHIHRNPHAAQIPDGGIRTVTASA